ncbi:MAG: hypothetical protein JRN56_01060 [Nitrososphaerota archaeon]|nr:hypothetical protein [Nitrososphaerota archaeon]MDG6911848.1 hypothetical protein [Nitrososphaerota archaeon]MDG6960981.1 hypothetical protein [Nitrososphaerota archaeon]MDG6979733.1 hypothetical protein [Nitrososphaerota archaeon]MDG6991752.1 hypothetical protein [Nitrososphaerota archaeon]
MMRPPRPMGIAILAILEILGGLLILLLGLAVAAVSGTLFSALGLAIPAGIGVAAGGVVVIFGLLGLLVGWGLWTGRGWARILAIILSGLGVLASLVGLALGSIPSLVGLVIDGFILWYMFRPNVRAFFGRSAQPMPLQPTP